MLTLTDSFLGRGYPEPGRDPVAVAATVLVLVARVLRLPRRGRGRSRR